MGGKEEESFVHLELTAKEGNPGDTGESSVQSAVANLWISRINSGSWTTGWRPVYLPFIEWGVGGGVLGTGNTAVDKACVCFSDTQCRWG